MTVVPAAILGARLSAGLAVRVVVQGVFRGGQCGRNGGAPLGFGTVGTLARVVGVGGLGWGWWGGRHLYWFGALPAAIVHVG